MKNYLLLSCFLIYVSNSSAQSCEGGLYLNPQVVRGEGVSQSENALKELVTFLKPTGLSMSPVINIKDLGDVLTANKRAVPPCWIYGNSVVGLASGFRPVAVNVDPIQSAVLVLADIGAEKDAKPVELKFLPADQQTKILAKLKTASCLGIKSGITTAIVKAENICGTVLEVVPQQGLGQNYLPTKAAFQWQADKWVGLITRIQTARNSTMKDHHGTDDRIHFARLLIVPAANSSWGYGLYVRQDTDANIVKKAKNQFLKLDKVDDLLSKALDIGNTYEFSTPTDEAIVQMKNLIAVR